MARRDSSGDHLGDYLEPTLKTDSQYEESLLRFFALHRLATPYMVQDAFPLWFDCHSTVMRHLNRLHNQGRLRRHSYGDGYVFGITQDGYTRCYDFMDPKTLPSRYEEPHGSQVEHELLITKTAVSIYEYVRSTPEVQVLEEGRFMLGNIEYIDPDTGEISHPFADRIPDYWYMIHDRGGWMIRFVEAIVGENSPKRIRDRLADYERWGQQAHVQAYLTSLYAKWGASAPKPEYEVHCILESTSWKYSDAWKERMTMLQSFQVSEKMQTRIWTATKDRLEEAWAEGLSINHPLWHRATELQQRRDEWDRVQRGKRTDFITRKMHSLRKYPLFA